MRARSERNSGGLLGCNFLLGTEGDATNVMLAVAGRKPRLLRAWLGWLLACLLSLLTLFDVTGDGGQPRALAA